MTLTETTPRSRWPLWFALGFLLLHLLANVLDTYGFFRDELYYRACTLRLDIGYVDHPPLSIWLLAAVRAVVGESVFAFRLLPAVFGAWTVYLAGLIAVRLGGGSFAQGFAAFLTAVCPDLVAMAGYYSMNIIDILLWSLAVLMVLRIQQEEDPRRDWLLLGVVVGLGLLNKISMAWPAAGIVAGFLLTPERRRLATPWPWIAGALAAAIAVPFVVWNFTHDFAHVEFARRAATLKYASQNPLTFLHGLVMNFNIPALPLWVAGLVLLVWERSWRVIGIMILTVLAILLINIHSKPEYFLPAAPILFAAGAIGWERLTTRRVRWLRIPYGVLVLVFGMIAVPVCLPFLTPPQLVAYQKAIRSEPQEAEGHHLNGLPPFFADRCGWREMTDSVAAVYRRLPPEDQASCAIIVGNYGEAGAIEFHGRSMGLPPVFAQHNSCYYWGLKEWNHARTVIIVRRGIEDLQSIFPSVEPASVTAAPWAMPYENGQTIWVCRGAVINFESVWKRGKFFI